MVKMSDSVVASRGKIVCDANLCTGCRACEVVCSLHHEGVINPELSRISITTWEYEAWRTEAYVCKQCEAANCMAACPTEAIHVDAQTGAIVIDESKCNGCQECIIACPSSPSRIRYNDSRMVCVKCDLCGGEPQCVISCQQGALTYERMRA
ncbi:MAG: 4Fe-4S dicluster domain-containing protein [Chloroflexi bacterium]|nr:4Fe-4S dicluster domain-containing protein [Chloroflexota bacterium]